MSEFTPTDKEIMAAGKVIAKTMDIRVRNMSVEVVNLYRTAELALIAAHEAKGG